MSGQSNHQPPAQGAAADNSSAEPPLDVVLSLASEPSAVEEPLPQTSEPQPAPDALPGVTSAQSSAARAQMPGRGRWLTPRRLGLVAFGLALLFLALIFSAWSTSAAGVIFPDWGLASLRVGIAAAVLGAVLLLALFAWRTRARAKRIYGSLLGLLLVFVGVGGILGAASLHRLQGRWFEGRGQYGLALAAFQASGESLANSQDMARISVEWAEQLGAQRDYGAAVVQIEPVVRLYKGDMALVARAERDLIGDYLAWGDQARQRGDLRSALAHYQALQSASYCDAACQAQTHARSAQALLGLAQQLASQQRYDEAVATYQQLLQGYGDTLEAGEARQALTAPQMLTGQLVYANHAPAKHFRVLLASQWSFNARKQVFTLSGQQYRAQADATGLFTFPAVMVGLTYMIAWIDTGGHAGTCNTTNNQPLYTVPVQPLRATDVGTINIECA